MSERATTLADEFERGNKDFIAAIEALPDTQWRARCEPEGWTVAAAARHVGSWYPLIATMVREIAAGRPMSMKGEQVNEINDREAVEHAACPKAEVVSLLRREGEALADLIRTLSDEQLSSTSPVFFGRARTVSAEHIVAQVLIPHTGSHRKNIEAAGTA